MNPGDEAEPGTPGTGEDVCPICQGTGRVLDEDEDEDEEGTTPCTNCGGAGVITEGIGGG